jgi:MFS family permease
MLHTYLLSYRLAGHLAKRIGFAWTTIIGITLMSVGLISASFSTEVWHLYLTQGLISLVCHKE